MKKKLSLIAAIIAVALIAAFGFTACEKVEAVSDDLLYKQGDFQKPAPESLLQGLPHSKAEIQELANAGDILGLYAAADANYGSIKQSGSFVVTTTRINVQSNKGQKFNVEQRSTYAVIGNPEGSYVQTISGMQDLGVVGMDLSAIAKNFGYMYRSYYDKAQKVSYGQQGASPDFTSADYLAGATCNWNGGTNATRDAVSTGGPGLTDAEIAASDTNLRRKTVKVDGKRYKRYVYKDERLYLYEYTAEQLEAGGAPKWEMWDVSAQRYTGYVVDFNGQTTGGNSGAHRKLPTGSFGKSQYQMDEEVLNMNECKVEKATDTDSNKTYYKLTFVWQEDQIDYACRYAKAALTKDINPFVAPYNTEYNYLTTTIEIWEDGLFKRWDREEKFFTEANAIMLGAGTGEAHNTAVEVFSYSDADTDVKGKYGNDTFWKGFSSTPIQDPK